MLSSLEAKMHFAILAMASLFVTTGCDQSPIQTPAGPIRSNDRSQFRALSDLSKDDIANADISILFIGNSHSAPLPKMLANIFKAHDPKLTTCIHAAPGYGFLDDHAESESTIELLQRGPWDVVILQGQKYSTSGKYTYSYDGSFELSRVAKENGSRIIMYPEWSRREEPDEYLRIDKIHQEIADKTGAEVAPIGITWVRAAETGNKLELYAEDGNHATEFGSYLNNCVFFSMLTGKPVPRWSLQPDDSPLPSAKPEQLDLLADAAWDSVSKMNLDKPRAEPVKD